MSYPNRTTQGRREVAQGKRPCLGEALRSVIGDDAVDTQTIIARLREKGWLPSSANQVAYIGHFLSTRSHPDDPHRLFDRVKGQRGWYRVAGVPRAEETCHAMKAFDFLGRENPLEHAVRDLARAAKVLQATAPVTSSNDAPPGDEPRSDAQLRAEATSLHNKFKGIDAHLTTAESVPPEQRAAYEHKAGALAKALLDRIGQGHVRVTTDVLAQLRKVARKPDLMAYCTACVRRRPLKHAQPTRAILAFVQANPGVPSTDITTRLGLPKQIVFSALSAMQSRGQIVRRISDGLWFPVSEKPDLKAVRERSARALKAALAELEKMPSGETFTSSSLAERIGKEVVSMSSILRVLAESGHIRREGKRWVRV